MSFSAAQLTRTVLPKSIFIDDLYNLQYNHGFTECLLFWLLFTSIMLHIGASGTHKQIEIKYAFIDPFIDFYCDWCEIQIFFKWT